MLAGLGFRFAIGRFRLDRSREIPEKRASS